MSDPVSVPARPSGRPPPSAPPPRAHGDPCTLVILGAAGDLARRKLLPAVYHLLREGLVPDGFRVLGLGLEPLDDGSFRALVRAALEQSDEVRGLDTAVWNQLAERLFYVAGDLTGPAIYEAAAARLEELEARPPATGANRLIYLAVPPSIFATIVDRLGGAGLARRTHDAAARPWTRVIVEKPFGRDLPSARALNEHVLGAFGEHQVYRIDHYLGKETVQNILVFRAANPIFEALWNHHYVSHVQITAAETVGVEARGRYYEEAGVVRDMFQNHLLQLLALTAMELPVAMTADAVRDEKVKALRAVVEPSPEAAVRAQYGPGAIKSAPARGYRDEPHVAPGSATPTYAAMRLTIDNYRWQGVPFYLRSGKRMARRVSEIAVTFRAPPHLIFQPGVGEHLQPNVLTIRVQPDEGLALRFEVKRPGAALALTPEVEVSTVEMDFSYADAFGDHHHPAYQTLLLDCMIGDATLFTRTDEVEAAWQLVDPLIAHWERAGAADLATYAAGSWGPAEADALVARDGFRWRTP